MKKPTLVMIPCFTGAPWDLSQMTSLKDYEMRTMKLPENFRDIELIADYVQDQVKDLDNYCLVGDSFGAVVALAIAIRNPKGLKGLIMSGGFAKNPIASPFLKFLSILVPYFPGSFYRGMTLRVHAYNLRSKFDKEGEIPWSTQKTLRFFVKSTPHQAYVNRIKAVKKVDYSNRLRQIDVPTLILTPEEDNLIGSEASAVMMAGIPNAKEEIISRTGHMFRFSHPGLYSKHIFTFLNGAPLQ
jgi:pimeloyl-ACP methyl ester carboxylesterase